MKEFCIKLHMHLEAETDAAALIKLGTALLRAASLDDLGELDGALTDLKGGSLTIGSVNSASLH